MLKQTLSDLIAAKMNRIDFFEQKGIDYYSRGNSTLEDEARSIGLLPDTLRTEMQEFDRKYATYNDPEWSALSLQELVDNIIGIHHTRLRKELPELFDLSGEVSENYGKDHPEIHQIEKVFGAFRFAMEAHIMTEEKVLFPTICEIERGEGHWQADVNPASQIRVRIREHDSSADDFRQLRKLSNNFTAPADTGESYRRFLRALSDLERDLHLHMHKENNILFPRASKLANELIEAHN